MSNRSADFLFTIHGCVTSHQKHVLNHVTNCKQWGGVCVYFSVTGLK